MNAQLSARDDARAREQRAQTSLQANSQDLNAWLALAEALEQQGRYGEAVDALRHGLELAPREVRLYNWFGNLLQHCGQNEGAAEVYAMALTLAPAAALHNNIAVALKKLGRLDEAREHLQQALTLAPNDYDALNNLGNILKLDGDPAAAIAQYRKILEQNPRDAAAYSNVGNACQALGDLQSAAQMYETALALQPQLAQAHWNRALLWLQQGDFERGWPEYRWGVATGDRPQRDLNAPCWQGDALHGRRIFIYAEQGFGDTLQFARFLPVLREQGAHVICECPAPLYNLLRNSELADDIIVAGTNPPAFDVYASLLDLPALLGVRLAMLPAPPSYLRIDQRRNAHWRAQLATGDESVRIGICWTGSPAYLANGQRSCALREFAPLAAIPGVRLFNLQRGPAAEQVASVGFALQPLDTEWDEFADMAAAIANLDLVITVDTSVAHLAGALGVQTWTLLAQMPDWRWLLERTDSPWYPSMRLFRQTRSGDWSELMQRVAAELARFSAPVTATEVKAPASESAEAAAPTATLEIAAEQSHASELLQQAMVKHQTGEWDAAAALYERILADDPNDADALRLLGTLAHRAGDLDRAAQLIGQALASVSDSALIYTSLGHVYKDQHAEGLALQCYRSALRLEPTFVDAWLGAGVVHQLEGETERAIDAYQNVLQLMPQHERAAVNLAMCWRMSSRDEEARTVLDDLLVHAPNSVAAKVQRAQLSYDAGHLDEAAQLLTQVLTIEPECVDAHRLLGSIHKDQGRHQMAVATFQRGLELQPDDIGLHNNLGNTYRAMGEADKAECCYLKTVELQPNLPAGYNNLGTLYKDRGQLSKAQEWFEKSLEVDPDFSFALGNLAKVYQETCCWDRYQTTLDRLIEHTERMLEEGKRVPMPPFFALSLPVSAVFQQRVARNFAQTVVLRGLVGADISRERKLDPSVRLRIGYVSSDFHYHATAQLMLSLFGLHDRAEFEIYAYSLGKDDGSDYRKRIEADCDQFLDVRELHYTDIARRIAEDGIHILVDLKGYTMDIRPEIFALRPAPIQVNYLGFPGTMGAEFIDYVITDQVVTPSEQQCYYDEKFARLPHSYQVNDHQQVVAAHTPARAECGLPEQSFVFCCFNNNYKIEPDVFGLWMRILEQVPGSVLWLFRASPESEQNLRAAAQSRGVDPQRLVFAPRMPKAEHLARHRLADLFLDTLYYNAHTTASDALWAGLPMLTCPGYTFAARVGASLLNAVGLPELIVASREAYVERAIELARDPQQLQTLRRRLQREPQTTPLFDTARFAKNLERAYREMWRRHANGEAPSAIDVIYSENPAMDAPARTLRESTGKGYPCQ